MLKRTNTLSKSLGFMLGALTLAAVATAAHADNPVTRTIDPYSALGNPYVRDFTLQNTATVVGQVTGTATWQGGSLSVAMSDPTVIYTYSMYHDCVVGRTITWGGAPVSGSQTTGFQYCSGWGVGNVNLGTNINVQNF